jgi:hypothetical protein
MEVFVDGVNVTSTADFDLTLDTSWVSNSLVIDNSAPIFTNTTNFGPWDASGIWSGTLLPATWPIDAAAPLTQEQHDSVDDAIIDLFARRLAGQRSRTIFRSHD